MAVSRMTLDSTGMGENLADDKMMDSFLASVERRAFLMARAALKHDEDAMDVVQDAMLYLVRKYRNKPADEWRPLFYQILNNRIRDVIRRRTVRNRFTGWLSGHFREDDSDPVQEVPDPRPNNPSLDVERFESMEELQDALEMLPARQLEAFMLRCWEGMSTLETAAIMKCSEGSVKTHYSRAIHHLRNRLEEHYHD